MAFCQPRSPDFRDCFRGTETTGPQTKNDRRAESREGQLRKEGGVSAAAIFWANVAAKGKEVRIQGVEFGMGASSSEFQTKILRRSFASDEYKVYRAALEWDVTEPIVIETRKDLKSEKRWQEHLEPYHHQIKNLITFCRRVPVTLL